MIVEDEPLLNHHNTFLEQVFLSLEGVGISVDNFELDHLCYRVNRLDRYFYLLGLLQNTHILLSESEINGRPIAIFLLKHPIVYQSRKIRLLELPAPKNGSSYEEGYEHVEFVIDQDLKNFTSDYPRVKFDTKGLNKPLNRDVRVSFGAISVKFHELPLRKVIEMEEASQSKAT